MKNVCLLTISCCLFFQLAFAQQAPVRFSNGNYTGNKNLLKGKIDPAALKAALHGNKMYTLVQFEQLPDDVTKRELAAQGIQLFDYLPGNAYMVEMPAGADIMLLKKYTASGVYTVTPDYKISPSLPGAINDIAAKPGHFIAVSFFGTLSKQEVSAQLTQLGAQVMPTKLQPSHVVFVKATADVVQKIATLPFVTWINAQVVKDAPLNYNNRATHGIDALAAPSGRGLQGKNVVVGVGDNGDPSTHIDFSGRLISRSPAFYLNGHGVHVTGTVGGGGLLNPVYKGMAPKSTLISQYFSDILINAPTYINDYGMVITNNSYASAEESCPGEGAYDVLSNYIDDQSKTYSQLLHVFAAGNDGTFTCSPYFNGYGVIKSGFQTGKNVLTVGAISTFNYTIASFSSWGPVDDGRVKPEIVAGGLGILSTFPDNLYGSDQGTSMASPTVAGAMALLYERYRQLHGGANPAASLIKTIACNTADDLGNAGPDYIYGFGMLNTRNAVEALENNRYFTGTLNNGGSATFTVTGVPAGTQQVKIMLYWPDAPGAPNAPVALVNNLDLTVTAPGGIVHRPLILNPSVPTVASPAVEGTDALNNIEQVVINNPPAGDFTVTINGTSIPSGPQDYIVSYEILNPSVTVEYPFGNETWVPGENETIRWSAQGGGANSFTIEYSSNNGGSWTTIGTAPAAARSFTWQVPSTPTNDALIRVTRDNVGYTDMSDYRFTILGQPVLTTNTPCRGFEKLTWNTIPSATQYEVMMLVGDSMQPIATTTDTSYLLTGLIAGENKWVTVRAVNGPNAGRRAVAQVISGLSGPCAAPDFDNDLTPELITGPVTGRKFTSTELGMQNITVGFRNQGSIGTTGSFNVSCQVNNGTVNTQNISPSIGPHGIYFYPFPAYDFSAVGTYNIKVWIDYPGDPYRANDTIRSTIKQLGNDALTLNPVFTEGFESSTPNEYTKPVYGLDGLDRCDFTTDSYNGRARTFINSGMARTGNRCITLDQSHDFGFFTTDSLTATFNLSNNSVSDQIWLNFYYKNHGTDFSAPANGVWIRGNDQSAWIPVFTLPHNLSDIGIYRASPNINVTQVLAAAVPAQTISSSFQVRFGQQGLTSANSVIADSTVDDGYSFDDIRLTHALNDVGIISIVAPSTAGSCGLSNAEQITVAVKNYGNVPATSVAVTYNVNGNTVIESIPNINPGETVNYTFTQTADLSVAQDYQLSVWVNYPTDNYNDNDSLLNTVYHNTPVVSSYPYLENFEASDGHWYAGGTNSSWQWGTINKPVFNKAASGTKAWTTSLTGLYNNNEESYLYSPCFNLAGLTKPVFSFSHIFAMEDNCDCDYHWIEYSTDDVNWIKLGASGSGINWYDNAGRQAWQLSQTKWHVSSFDIPTIGAPKVRFRIAVSSDIFVSYAGVGIDDIHVFDKAAIYTGTNLSSGITQSVSGTNWINFDMGANRVVSINPNGQNLGNTTVKAFINTGPVRISTNQYYLDRNIVIQPAIPPASDVTVRFYFTDAEANRLINAAGCGGCTTIGDAYEAGVTQYSNALPEEDSTLDNNLSGVYLFHVPQTDVHIVPYDNGYYAEYHVSNFSEFWINGGGAGHNQPLPLSLLSFVVNKTNNKALLKWTTISEVNTDKFIVEKSIDGLHFNAIGTVTANGNTSTETNYQFTDENLVKGVNYYRLKMVDKDARFVYSSVRTILYAANDFAIQVYPNPATKGVLYIATSVNCSRIEITDASGKTVKATDAKGLQNKISLANISQGVYFVTVVTDAGKKVEKIIVQ